MIFNALRNASEELGRKISDLDNQTRLIEGLSNVLKLRKVPERIEIYDNSHIQGAYAVGAMVVFGAEGFIKSQYRKFNIKDKTLSSGDDVGMMRHVLERRFAHRNDEEAEKFSANSPDLILIDGGSSQVSATCEVLKKLKLETISVFGVAKGSERNSGKEQFYPAKGASFALKFKDPILFFIQRLRDEAHRFAIGAHRKKRLKSVSFNRLDDIPGVGTSRKRSLLAHFGSAKAVSQAGLDDLKAVDGISKATAELVYNYFHDLNR